MSGEGIQASTSKAVTWIWPAEKAVNRETLDDESQVDHKSSIHFRPWHGKMGCCYTLTMSFLWHCTCRSLCPSIQVENEIFFGSWDFYKEGNHTSWVLDICALMSRSFKEAESCCRWWEVCYNFSIVSDLPFPGKSRMSLVASLFTFEGPGNISSPDLEWP